MSVLINRLKWIQTKYQSWKNQPLSMDPSSDPMPSPSYFQTATHWADDLYTQMVTSRNRYRALFGATFGLVFLLAINLIWLIPTQTLQPFLVHHYEDGYTRVEPLSEWAAPTSRAQVEADLVRYVWHRESYARAIYHILYPVIEALSAPSVLNEYVAQESVRNPHARIHQFGTRGKREIQVESVIFLDHERLTPIDPLREADTHHNVAQLQYKVSEIAVDGATIHTFWLAFIAWEYQGAPAHARERWQNHNGFTVTHYTTHPRQVFQ